MRQPSTAPSGRGLRIGSVLLVGWLILMGPGHAAPGDPGADPGTDPGPVAPGPLPGPPAPVDARQAELGRLLFTDGRLSGDGSTSCATCHDLGKAGTDGLALAKGYPGALHFRNTPTVINAALGRYLYWDGRLPASDLATLVRDHLSEAHFMQADGRLLIERLRQIPHYEEGFRVAFGGEPSYGKILSAIAAYLTTLRSREVPFDRHLAGEPGAISEAAARGLELFRGRAGCIRCHHGPMFTDGRFHSLGLPTGSGILDDPLRHITLRRFMATLGVPGYGQIREDPGRYAITKEPGDRGRFRTPTLREVARTGPYMHDGSLATLEDVVELYDRGGGPGALKDPALRPLGLSSSMKVDLVEFLKTLSGTPGPVDPVDLPQYELRRAEGGGR